MLWKIMSFWLAMIILFLYLVAYLSSYRKKTIKALQRAPLRVDSRMFTTLRLGKSR